MGIVDKFVNFILYCTSCKYRNKKETEEPCSECLGEPVNTNTSKPVRWEESK